MTAWIAMGRDAAQVRACAMQGTQLLRMALGADDAAALAGLDYGSETIIRIGDGVPAVLPAPVLPASGHSLPGFTQDAPADVISGWVRLWAAGFLANTPNWDGVICAVHGDISHWIHISADEAISCQSFMTPRLIATLGGAVPPDPEALADSLSRPERLAAHLRVAEVASKPQALTGHLIGAELTAARAYWLGQQVALITPDGDASGYLAALEPQGVPVEVSTPIDLLPAGLAALGRALQLTDG